MAVGGIVVRRDYDRGGGDWTPRQHLDVDGFGCHLDGGDCGRASLVADGGVVVGRDKDRRRSIWRQHLDVFINVWMGGADTSGVS